MAAFGKAECPSSLRVIGRLPSFTWPCVCRGACGQASNKPRGRKPRGGPGRSEFRVAMAIDGLASSALLEEGGSNRMLEESRRRDDAMHWCEGAEEVDERESA